MIILTLFFVLLFSAIFALVPAAILYAAYVFVILAIFPAFPVITFGQIYLVTLAISVIGGMFKSDVTINK